MKRVLKLAARWEVLLMLLIIGGGIWSWTLSSYFLQTSNILDVATPYVFMGMMALGLTFVVIAGEIDISIVSTMAVAAVVCAQLWHSGANIWLAATVALLVGTALGLLNGVLIGALNLPALAITLGTLAAIVAVALVLGR